MQLFWGASLQLFSHKIPLGVTFKKGRSRVPGYWKEQQNQQCPIAPAIVLGQDLPQCSLFYYMGLGEAEAGQLLETFWRKPS
jgi:hypothetical protein